MSWVVIPVGMLLVVVLEGGEAVLFLVPVMFVAFDAGLVPLPVEHPASTPTMLNTTPAVTNCLYRCNLYLPSSMYANETKSSHV